MRSLGFVILSLLLWGCQKDTLIPEQKVSSSSKAPNLALDLPTAIVTSPVLQTGYILHTIKKGSHNSDKSSLKSVKTSEMKFYAYFDSSAEYKNVDPVNQYDINKLWGFSEGFNNQYNSCRIGWSYNDGKYGGITQIGTLGLRLSAYSYAKGIRYSKEICVIPMKTPVYCSIKPTATGYVCSVTVNGIKYSTTINRGTTTTTASGYQQYPYFGGDEVAPQNIFIQIKPA
jgi:hypothetical protein